VALPRAVIPADHHRPSDEPEFEMTTADSATGPALDAPELSADPYGEFDRLRERAPLLRGRYLDGSPIWYLTRYQDVRSMLADPRFANSSASVPGELGSSAKQRLISSFGVPPELVEYVVGTILDSDGPRHTRLRKLVSRAFTVRRVSELRPSVERIAAELLDELAATSAAGPGPVDLLERFCYPLPITVICDLVGIPVADRPAWRIWGRELVSRVPERFVPVLREVVDYLHELLESHRASPADDLLSELIRTHDEDGDRLSDVELITMVLTLVFAGHETTAQLLGNATVALLTHPDQLALLRADPTLWPGAVHELIRLRSPVLITAPRYATQDLECAGVRVRAGDAVQPVLVSANRDPRQWDEPQRLDVTRRPEGHGEGHVGFGHGAHYCLGAALARQEAEVALRALFERFGDLALGTDPAELVWQPTPGSRRLAALPVNLGPTG
jgi:cytochrome P450